MRAKIKFPIRLKLLLLMSALVVISIITYLTLAIKLFRDDKTTLIYDLNANVVRTIGSEFRGDLDRYGSSVRLLSQGYQNPDWLRVLLSNDRDLLGFRLYEAGENGELVEIHSLDRQKPFLEEKELSDEAWQSWTRGLKVPVHSNPAKNSVWISAKFLSPNAPVIAYAEGARFEGALKPKILVGLFRADRWWTTLKSQGIVTPFLVDAEGKVLLHPDPRMVERTDLSTHPLVAQAIQSPLALELKSFDYLGKSYLGAFSDVGAGPKIIATVPSDEVFRASVRLINKSLLFGLLIVTIALILSVRVAKSLTSPISALVTATESMGRGRFAASVAVRSNDEVGELANAFNTMAGSLETLQKQLVESERHAAIGQVARGVGHEFGNILMRVFGKIDLALLDTQEPKTKAHLETALQAVERAKVILQNLRSYSKTDGANVSAPKKLVVLSTIFDQTLTLMNHELKVGNIEVKRDYGVVDAVMGDDVALGQVFLNLAINAKQAMPKGGTLSIRIQPGKSSEELAGVSIEVQDTGGGIPPDVLPKIFETAFSTKGDQGTGLGLAISKTIIEQHGGHITASSVAGAGATFHIWLPEASSAPVEGGIAHG